MVSELGGEIARDELWRPYDAGCDIWRLSTNCNDDNKGIETVDGSLDGSTGHITFGSGIATISQVGGTVGHVPTRLELTPAPTVGLNPSKIPSGPLHPFGGGSATPDPSSDSPTSSVNNPLACPHRGRTRFTLDATTKYGTQTIFSADMNIPDSPTWTWNWGEQDLQDVPLWSLNDAVITANLHSPGECDFRTPVEAQIFLRDPETVPGDLVEEFGDWLLRFGIQNKEFYQLAKPSPSDDIVAQVTTPLRWGAGGEIRLPNVLSIMYPSISWGPGLANTPKPFSNLNPTKVSISSLQNYMTQGFHPDPLNQPPSIRAIRVVQNVGSGGCSVHFDYATMLQQITGQLTAQLRKGVRNYVCADGDGARFLQIERLVIVPTLRHPPSNDPGFLPEVADSLGGILAYIHAITEQGDAYGGCDSIGMQEYSFVLHEGILALVAVGQTNLLFSKGHSGTLDLNSSACTSHSIGGIFPYLIPVFGFRGLTESLDLILHDTKTTSSIQGAVNAGTDFMQFVPTPPKAAPLVGLPSLPAIPLIFTCDPSAPPGATSCEQTMKPFITGLLDNPNETPLDPWTGLSLGPKGSPQRQHLIDEVNSVGKGRLTNFRCAPPGFCQYGVRAKRIVPHPDELVLVLWDDANDFDSTARVLDILTQTTFARTAGVAFGAVGRTLCQARATLDPWSFLVGVNQPAFAPGSFERVQPAFTGNLSVDRQAIYSQEAIQPIWDRRRFPVGVFDADTNPQFGCFQSEQCMNRVLEILGGQVFSPSNPPCCDGTWKAFHRCFPELRIG